MSSLADNSFIECNPWPFLIKVGKVVMEITGYRNLWMSSFERGPYFDGSS